MGDPPSAADGQDADLSPSALPTPPATFSLQEILTDIPLGKHNREPVLRVQKMENAKKALDRIKEMGVQLTNIGPEGESHLGALNRTRRCGGPS